MRSKGLRRWMAGAAVGVAGAMMLAACGSSGAGTSASPSSSAAASSATPEKTLQIAYLSFAVANSYDAPMLAAAQAVAAENNAKLTVFDANNDPKTQFSQMQNVITSGKYDGIIVQPILATGLTDLVQQAVAAGIKVVNIDQTMGPSYDTFQPQVDGLSANVTFVASDIGTKLGQLTVQYCQEQNLNPCNVGYMYDIKASSLDVAIRDAFDKAVAGSPVAVVAEGEDYFTPAYGVKATENMLQAHKDIKVIVASDQGMEGATQAFAANKTTGVMMIGFGGSAAGLSYVKAGTAYATVYQAPASEGQLGVKALIDALRNGTDGGGIDPLAGLPDNGIVTQANVDQFTAEWPG